MPSVYVVTSGSYSDYCIQAVFSTKELAEAFAAVRPSYYDVQEWILDERQPERLVMLHTAKLDYEGEFWGEFSKETLVEGGTRGECKWMGGSWMAESTVSLEHAKKLCVEARQKHLREIANSPPPKPREPGVPIWVHMFGNR